MVSSVEPWEGFTCSSNAVCTFARHIASASDLAQAPAVGYALAGRNGVMPVIVRTSAKPYRWKIAPAPLTDIANREKTMPKGFIDRRGFGITAACRAYLLPLIKGEAPPPYRPDGLPDYVRLKSQPVARKLPAWRD